jgi:O-antigen ligase
MNETEQTYLKIIKWGLFLSVFTPLILYSQFLSMFNFSKVIVFRSIVEIILILYILLILDNPKYRPKWNALLIAVTFFMAVYVLTSVTGVNFYRSFWGTLERMEGVFTFLHFWLFFLILVSIFKNKEDWLKLLRLAIVAGFLSILFAYGQYFKLGDFFVGWQHGSRIIGTVGNAALFAGYLIFILFLAICFLFRRDTSKKARIFYIIVLVLGIPALFLTAVRGSIISFLVGIFLLGIFNLINSKNLKIKQGTIIFIGLLLILVSIFWFSRNQSWVQENQYLKRITDISLETRTIQTRLSTWKSAWQGWQERFLLGWGPENFNLLFAKCFNPIHYQGFGSEVVWDRAHNVFLNTGATMGLVGLLAYFGIFGVLAYYFIRAFKIKKIRKLTLAIFGTMLLVYVGHNMFIFDSFNSYLMFFVVLGYLGFLFGITDKKSEIEETKEIKSAKPRTALLIILALIVIFTIYKTAIIPAKANYAATRGIVYGRSDKYFPVAFDYFRKSLSYNAIQTDYEVRHELARMVFAVFSKTDNPQELGVKEDDLVFALDEVYKNIKTDPLDPIPYLYVARLNEFLSRINQEKAKERLDKAEESLNKAKSLNEKNPYIYFELGQVYIFRGDFKKAIDFFDEGISLKPEVELGYWYKGVTLLTMGNIKGGEDFIRQAMERGFVKSVSDIYELLRVYVPLKNYPKIIELYLEAIKLQPTNAQLYASLATAYKENGEIDKAIETARKVGELDPKLKPEADAWINVLRGQYK